MNNFITNNTTTLKFKEGATSFFETNEEGDFLFLSNKIISKYNGLFVKRDEGYFKLLTQFVLENEITNINYDLFNFKRNHSTSVEQFDLLNSGLIYKVRNYNGKIKLFLDIRKMYDYSDEGRIYDFQFEKDMVIIKYNKYKNNDLNNNNKDYSFYLGILYTGPILKGNDWEEFFYSYDKNRKDRPYSSWQYKGIIFEVENNADIFISYGATEEEVRSKIRYLYNRCYIESSEKRCKKYELYQNNFKSQLFSNKKYLSEKLAYFSAKNSLFQLKTPYGILAGLPWFHQVWARDELISFGGLIEENIDLFFVKERLLYYLGTVQKDGKVPNRMPKSDLSSVDGVGWLSKRLLDLLKKHPQLFIEEELDYILERVEKIIFRLRNYYTYNSFLYNKPLETWMDTGQNIGDTREGFRVEIQSLFLNIYELSLFLSNLLNRERKYENNFNDLKKNLKKSFFFGNKLADGKTDFTIRPNIFLSYYLTPYLLSKTEWESVFDLALKNLWLNWGGLSTIEKENPLFQPIHTGVDNKSYHRGDSWFFINHIVAVSLLDLNKLKYLSKVNKIINATISEMFESGSLGSIAEISSAHALTSFGCFNQAWSNSTFIELINKKWKKN